ncbi:MAG: AIR synthase-related protein, partial [Planctomycetota bacterium]
TKAAGKKGRPQPGDFVVLVGGRTGNDGLHGATVSSSGITQDTDQGDSTHVQIGLPYTEQLMMRAGLELRDQDCCSARNDFGAAGIVSCFGEMGSTTEGGGGIFINLALVPLKCAGMANWQIALSESQERFGHAIKEEKLEEALAIYERYGLEATVIGQFTDTGRFQMAYDPQDKSLASLLDLKREVCLDVPYAYFDECPLPEVQVSEPTRSTMQVRYPRITRHNMMELGLRVVSHFDVADQSTATSQYDSTVQGITVQGPLYGVNQNISSSLGVLSPIFGSLSVATLSRSFSPWQFEIDPVAAAVNALMDALATQVIAGVHIEDIALADNFYTDGADPESLWYLREQVKALVEYALRIKVPFIVGKDSSAGRGTFGGTTVKVPPSVCITALGKKKDGDKLILHQWQEPGNKLVLLGPQTERLDGSILSTSLGITGNKLDQFPLEKSLGYLSRISRLARGETPMTIHSAVPINRGGLLLRLFEGMEASGFGFHADDVDPDMLFPENMGCVLVEMSPEDVPRLSSFFDQRLEYRSVGTIVPDREFSVRGYHLDLNRLRTAWQQSFKEAVYDC